MNSAPPSQVARARKPAADGACEDGCPPEAARSSLPAELAGGESGGESGGGAQPLPPKADEPAELTGVDGGDSQPSPPEAGPSSLPVELTGVEISVDSQSCPPTPGRSSVPAELTGGGGGSDSKPLPLPPSGSDGGGDPQPLPSSLPAELTGGDGGSDSQPAPPSGSDGGGDAHSLPARAGRSSLPAELTGGESQGGGDSQPLPRKAGRSSMPAELQIGGDAGCASHPLPANKGRSPLGGDSSHRGKGAKKTRGSVGLGLDAEAPDKPPAMRVRLGGAAAVQEDSPTGAHTRLLKDEDRESASPREDDSPRVGETPGGGAPGARRQSLPSALKRAPGQQYMRDDKTTESGMARKKAQIGMVVTVSVPAEEHQPRRSTRMTPQMSKDAARNVQRTATAMSFGRSRYIKTDKREPYSALEFAEFAPAPCICLECLYPYKLRQRMFVKVYENRLVANLPCAPFMCFTCSEKCIVDCPMLSFHDRAPTRAGMCCLCIPCTCCGPPVIYVDTPSCLCINCESCYGQSIMAAPSSFCGMKRYICCGDPCYLCCGVTLFSGVTNAEEFLVGWQDASSHYACKRGIPRAQMAKFEFERDSCLPQYPRNEKRGMHKLVSTE